MDDDNPPMVTVDLEADGTESVLPPYQRAVTTQQLIDRLKEMEIDEIVTFRELTALTGKPITSSSSYLKTAMTRMLKDYGIVLDSVRSIGYRRISSQEIITTDDRYRRKQRKNAERATKRLDTADPAELSRDEQIMLVQKRTVHHLVIQNLRPKNLRRVDEAVARGLEQRSGAIQINLTALLQTLNG